MTEKEERRKKQKKIERSFYIEETKSAVDTFKRMIVEIPKDLKEPKTPGPTKTKKKEKQE